MKTLLMIFPEGGLLEEFTGLLSSDFELIMTHSETEACQIVHDRLGEISAVVVDLELSRKAGYPIMDFLDSDRIYASIPVIAVIDHTPKEEELDCFDRGFSDLLYPPGFRRNIVKRLQNAIRAKDSFTYTEMQKMLKQPYESADKALYYVKKHGRGNWHIYEKPAYKAVVFDMDGTILNTIEDLLEATNYALRKHGFQEHTVEEQYYFVGNGLKNTVLRALPADTSPEIAEMVYTDMVEYYSAHSEDHTRPYEGIVEVIKKLREKGLKTAVVSNKAHFAMQTLVDKYFKGCFDETMGETEGFALKPDKAMVYEVLRRLDVPVPEAVYVGDSNVDLMTAQNAGMDCIAVSWGFRSRNVLEELGANPIIDKPEELLGFFDKAP